MKDDAELQIINSDIFTSSPQMALPAAIWSSYSKELYASSAPPLGTVDLQKLEDAAREHLIKVANEGELFLQSNLAAEFADISR
jgi:hypothetical protein